MADSVATLFSYCCEFLQTSFLGDPVSSLRIYRTPQGFATDVGKPPRNSDAESRSLMS